MQSRQMRSLYIRENTNIDNYPEISESHKFDRGAQLTIGDLHGNALKLFYFLIKHRVFTNVSHEDYRQFVKLYKKNTQSITKEDLSKFKKLLAKVKVNNKGTVRLIGDDLADRGSNDYFTLKILQKLLDKGCGLEVLLSNHLGEFIEAHETRADYVPQGLQNGLAGSMQRMNDLIVRGLIDKKEIKNIFNKQYIQNLKVLSYTFNPETKQMSIYSHAPIGLQTIRGLAQKLGIQYKDRKMEDLARTIDAINTKFLTDYVARARIHELFDNDFLDDPFDIDPITHPFAHLMWNRDHHSLQRPEDYKDYHLKFIHGHDYNQRAVRGRVYNLDNELGKHPELHEGRYNIHYTHEIQLNTPANRRAAQQRHGLAGRRALPQQNLGHGLVAMAMLTPLLTFTSSFAMFGAISTLAGISALAVGVGLLIVTSLRNQKFKARADEIVRNPTLTTQEENAFMHGQTAANSWTAYAKSFFSVTDWQHANTFGAGMVQPFEEEVAEDPRKRRARRAR